jgi:hypothetical protein
MTIVLVAKWGEAVLKFLIIGVLVPFSELDCKDSLQIGKRGLVAIELEGNVAILHILCTLVERRDMTVQSCKACAIMTVAW